MAETKAAERKFTYYLKLKNGRLLHAEGSSAEAAARAAGVTLAEVKRHMPVKAMLTLAELEVRTRRFAELRKRKKASEDELD